MGVLSETGGNILFDELFHLDLQQFCRVDQNRYSREGNSGRAQSMLGQLAGSPGTGGGSR
jgi:hypothetical protein